MKKGRGGRSFGGERRDGFHYNRHQVPRQVVSSSSSSSSNPAPAPASSSNSPTNPQNLVGTCPDMCPAKERAQRERLRDLSVLERLNEDTTKTSPTLAVKKFCRTISSADVNVSDIRPLPVLKQTLDYLMKLLDSTNFPFEIVHDFIFDRTRSIRQDLTMQNLVSPEAAQIYEDIVKFHIISHQKLAKCWGRPEISSLCHLNVEQLIKCLLSLYDMYQVIGKGKCTSNKEAEFYSLYVLLHLGNNLPKMGETLSLWYRQLAHSVHLAKEVQIAKKILRYAEMGNFKLFFSTVAMDLTNLQFGLIEPFLNEVRARAIVQFNQSCYKLQPIPMRHLSELLMVKEEELEQLCKSCSLETSMDDTGIRLLPCKQATFCIPKSGFPFIGISANQSI
ncbi:SAC3/GANP/Nin1/mts3/eIF-3 p25 family [Rhynchospora pubera]|uniref:SAC3/GANP/Nin1/mts3/eIF-3 p25 family n=1 Tax=Rhynchospora pubera TaxID=906938 RepID=A0AAV8D876_9POAL|nr:SAC3/GANP/Nin1/mts3/eIF-3 p25 family [Rhynchospora pubera]